MTNTQHRVLTPKGIYAQEGDLATMSINGDSYIVIIDKVTPKTITVQPTMRTAENTYVQAFRDDPRTFRWNEKRQTYVYQQHFHLTLGKAVERRDPSF